MACLKVAITGAGPSGCLLARFLHKAGVDVTVFEAEESLSVGSQGGTLDLYPRTGIAALEAAGLGVEVARQIRHHGSRLKFVDKKLQHDESDVLHQGSASDRNRILGDRSRVLRRAGCPGDILPHATPGRRLQRLFWSQTPYPMTGAIGMKELLRVSIG